MTTKYNLRRRDTLRGLRTRRDWLADTWRRARNSVEIVAGLLILLVTVGWMTERDLRDGDAARIEQAEAATARAHKMIAHVMSGRPVLERETGTVVFFQVSRQEGL